MKFKYYIGPLFLCESETKCNIGKDFPAVREVVEKDVKPLPKVEEDTKFSSKKKETVNGTVKDGEGK